MINKKELETALRFLEKDKEHRKLEDVVDDILGEDEKKKRKFAVDLLT